MVATAATAVNLDFTNVKDGGPSFNKKRVPMGDYLAKVVSVIDAPTKPNSAKGTKGGDPQWLFVIELVDQYTDRKFPYYCKLEANQLWKVRNLFLAAGKAIPKKKVRLNPGLVVGKLIAVTLEDDEYDGKMQSNVVQIFSPNELDDSATEDLDGEETEDLDDEEEEEVAPAPARRKKAAPEPEPEEDEEEDEEAAEDEEEEPQPAPKARIPGQRRSSPTPAKKAAARKPVAAVAVDDDELEELDLEDL